MSSVFSSVRHSPNEFLKTFSLICFFALMIYSGQYCFALYLASGTAALLAGRHKQIYNPLRCPAILESQVAHCNITGYKHIPKHIHLSWETTTVCQRHPAIQIPTDMIICNPNFSACLQNIPLDLKSSDCYSWAPCPWYAVQPSEPLSSPMGDQQQSGQHKHVPAFLRSHSSCTKAFLRLADTSLSPCRAVFLHAGWWFPFTLAQGCRMRMR